MVSMIPEDRLLCQKEASFFVWYGFSHLLLISEVLNILSKFRSHSNLSFTLFAFSWNKLCRYGTLQFTYFLNTQKIHIFIQKIISNCWFLQEISPIHLKTFYLVANSIFFVYFKAKLFPFLVSKIWTLHLWKLWRGRAIWCFQAIVWLLMFCQLGFVFLHLNMPVFKYKGISYIS